MNALTKSLSLCTLLTIPVMATANPGGHRPPHGPPPEAVEACADLEAGDTCQFEGRHGEEAGTCEPGPSPELPLACRPEGHEGPPPAR